MTCNTIALQNSVAQAGYAIVACLRSYIGPKPAMTFLHPRISTYISFSTLLRFPQSITLPICVFLKVLFLSINSLPLPLKCILNRHDVLVQRPQQQLACAHHITRSSYVTSTCYLIAVKQSEPRKRAAEIQTSVATIK